MYCAVYDVKLSVFHYVQEEEKTGRKSAIIQCTTLVVLIYHYSTLTSSQVRDMVPESSAYMDLLTFEQKLDTTIQRKRIELQESLKRPSLTKVTYKHNTCVLFVSVYWKECSEICLTTWIFTDKHSKSSYIEPDFNVFFFFTIQYLLLLCMYMYSLYMHACTCVHLQVHSWFPIIC